MSNYPAFSETFTAISGLSVSGLTIYSMANRPNDITVRECPCVAPVNTSAGDSEPQSLGVAGAAQYEPRCTLNYIFIYTPYKSYRIEGYIHDLALQKLTAFITAVRNADTTLGVERVTLASVGEMGEIVMQGPVKNRFFGCELSFNFWQIKQ